jgi:hypothetical protein
MVQSIDAFPVSWFKRHIPTECREAIKQKLDHQGRDEPRFGQPVTNPARPMEQIDTLSSFRTKQLLGRFRPAP